MPASAITSNDISARVRARWAAMLPITLIARADHNIALTIFAGMERLVRSVRETTDRALVTREVTNQSPVAGKLDISVAAFNQFLVDSFKMPGAINTNADSALVFKHVASLDALKATMPTDTTCVWYHLRNRDTIIFRNPATGDLNTYTTALNLNGIYIPVLGDVTWVLDSRLDDQLVDRVAETVKELGGLQFLQLDPEMAGAAAAAVK